MAKRAATTDLNYDNWDKEDEQEDPGVFQPASSDILAGRVIKTAKRRFKTDSESGPKPSPFSGFTGFGNATSSSNSSTFSFLSQNKPKEGDKNGVKGNDLGSKESQSQFKSFSFSAGLQKDSEVPKATAESWKPFENIFKPKLPNDKDVSKKSTNLESLKELNLSCSSWITEHLGKNPYCILTPIFKDYEKYLAQLNLNLNSEDKEITILSEKINTNSPAETAKFSSKDESSESVKIDNEKSKEFKIEISPAQKPFSFQFGNNNSLGGSTTTFSLNQISAKPFVADSESKNDDEEPEEPPKNDFVPVVEEDSVYDIKCKVFVKKESSFVSRGVGTLFLKPIKDSSKTQLVVRAHTNLGNILLNVLLAPGMPIQKHGKNNAMLVCIPTPDSKPPPVPVLIRVKTSDECDQLIKKLEESRGS